jgi:hypothetical protein
MGRLLKLWRIRFFNGYTIIVEHVGERTMVRVVDALVVAVVAVVVAAAAAVVVAITVVADVVVAVVTLCT